MLLTPDQIEIAIRDFGETARLEWQRLAKIDEVVRGNHDKPRFENSAEARKHDKLWKASTLNLVGQTVNAYGQRLAVDGWRVDELDRQTTSTPWLIWMRSGMDALQKRLFGAALAHGYSYLYAGRSDSAPGAVLKPVNGRKVWCHYADDDDDWPDFALQVDKKNWRVWDDENIYTVPVDVVGSAVTLRMTVESHGTGVVPFSRLDADWGTLRSRGLVDPLLPLNDMVNRITFVLNLIGENSSFALRFMTGTEPKVDDDGNPIEPNVGPNKIMLLTDAQGKMGQLDPSDPTGLVAYWSKLVEKFFSLAQLPPHYLIGQMANLSAEALVAAESTFAFALNDFCRTFGLGIDRGMRLASAIAGDEAAAQDESRVWWAPVTVKSLAAEVDALGKMVQMLEVPVEATWERIPGVDRQTVEQWQRMRERELADQVGQVADAQVARMMGGVE